jgi:uncharacterized protein (UPF0264 family)
VTTIRDRPAGAGPLLLASAATIEDVDAAFAGGAGIVDLKDPGAGVLGACDAAILADAAARRGRLDPSRPLSAAIGPARDPAAPQRAATAARLGYDYVKAGLDGVSDADEAVALLGAIVTALRAADGDADRGEPTGAGRGTTQLIAATYAEVTAAALGLDALPEIADRAGCRGCLLDTAVKNGRTLFDHRDAAALGRFVAAARGRGLVVALAGALGDAEVTRAAALRPDVIGLRGALCVGGRAGRLSPARVRRFVALLATAPRPAIGR